MAHKKVGGSTKQHHQRAGKRLGIKVSGGAKIKTGEVIVTQRGTKYHPGTGVSIGRDHTIFALKSGVVTFSDRFGKKIICVS